ncbi:MAG: ABC-type oligopeptide transport system ATPase subunit [Planctomycetota bacterium]|jgi:ABC-type oligopeptide transport system ATPase subunit
MSLLEVNELCVRFNVGRRLFGGSRGVVDAVDHASFELNAGETLALVGGTGSGKSTLARAVLGLQSIRSGSVTYTRLDGERINLFDLPASRMRSLRTDLQIVFQNPSSSLNPRFRVRELLAEAPRLHFGLDETEVDRRVAEALTSVGLDAECARRYSHEFSAGQRQRIAIARALILKPRVLVCDEITSSLDVSVQAGILNLLLELQQNHGLAYLFIAHDLSVVRVLAHRIAVMQAGQLVEVGTSQQVFEEPAHPYTRELLNAIP